jgi:glycosyltransferase involved in cell wall biosynthesis
MIGLAPGTTETEYEACRQGRSLKVCLATMAPFIGGAEVAVERLALGLQQAGHEVFLLVGTDGPALKRLQLAGLRCIHAPMYYTDKWRWLRYVRARNALRGHLRREQPDVLHSNDLTTHQIMSDAARGLRIPRICHHRFCYASAFTEWLNKFGAEHHLFVSRALMKDHGSYGSHWESYSRAVVYDGLPLPPPPTAQSRREARQRLGLPAHRVVVTFAGQIIERKGVADLLHAWARLADEVRQRSELVIVGDDLDGQGKYRVAMEALAAQLACPARFVGFQKNVAEWLLASDVATVPSHVEPLGNATLEAMAFALPVIGGDVGGIPEMIVHGQTGLLAAPRAPEHLAACLDRLLRDQDVRVRYGNEGRRRCQEVFSLEAHVTAVLAEYRKVIERHQLARVS